MIGLINRSEQALNRGEEVRGKAKISRKIRQVIGIVLLVAIVGMVVALAYVTFNFLVTSFFRFVLWAEKNVPVKVIALMGFGGILLITTKGEAKK